MNLMRIFYNCICHLRLSNRLLRYPTGFKRLKQNQLFHKIKDDNVFHVFTETYIIPKQSVHT